MFARYSVRLLLIPLALASVSCARSVDIQQAIELTDTSGGWFDAGIVDGQPKLVPSVSFRLRKKADVELERAALNVVFRHPAGPDSKEEEDWEDVYIQTVTFEEGTQTALVTARPDKGYRGDPEHKRSDILSHSMFRDVYARVFARANSTQWVDIGTIQIPRELITR